MRKLGCLVALCLSLVSPAMAQPAKPVGSSPAADFRGDGHRPPQDQVLVENESFAFDKPVFELWGLRPFGTSSACFSPAALWPTLGLAEAALDPDSSEHLYRFFDLDRLELRLALKRQRFEMQLGAQEGLIFNRSTLWVDRPRIVGSYLKPAIRIRARSLGGDIQTADFRNPLAVARQIDGAQAYRSGRSHPGRLPDVIDSGAVVASSAVLTARWVRPFSLRATTTATFHGERGATPVAMMHQTGVFPCLVAELGESNDFSLVELAYDRLDWAMDVVLPAEGHSLEEVEGELNPDCLRDSLESMERRPLSLSLPRFHMHTGGDLRAPLAQLGLAELFSPSAFLSELYTLGAPRRLAGVLQETDVVCIEQGSIRPGKASRHVPPPPKTKLRRGKHALIGVKTDRLDGRSSPSLLDPPVPFRVDRPFFFVVRQRSTGMIMFMGRYCGPQGG